MCAFSKPQCPECGSTEYSPKAFRYNKRGTVRILRCKSCLTLYTKKWRKTWEDFKDAYVEYALKSSCLDVIADKCGLSRSTFHRWFTKYAMCHTNYEGLLDEKISRIRKQREDIVMGIDTAIFSIKRNIRFVGVDGLSHSRVQKEEHCYLHVVDVMSKEVLIYTFLDKENTATLVPLLYRLKTAGYNPQIIVSDLDSKLLQSSEVVYPDAILQACIVHLTALLDTKLPTTNEVRGLSKKDIKLYGDVKEVIYQIATSENKEIRQTYMQRLRSLYEDINKKIEIALTKEDRKNVKAAKEAIEEFWGTLKYYHTMDELKGDFKRKRTNNLCENNIGQLKHRFYTMKKFKNFDFWCAFVNLYWYHHRMPTADERITAKSYLMPLSFFSGCNNLDKLSAATDIPRELLEQETKKMGLKIFGNFSFSEDKLKIIEKRFKRLPKQTNLDDVIYKSGYDEPTVIDLLRHYGMPIRYDILDRSKVMIINEDLSGTKIENDKKTKEEDPK